MLTSPGVTIGRGVSGLRSPSVTEHQRQPLSRILAQLGITPALCLDAGDGASYAGGQTWFDTSGNARNVFLGADGTSESTDPSFVGPFGSLSRASYFLFGGTSFFKKTTANGTYLNGLHKDNAAWSIFGEIWQPASPASSSVIDTRTSGTSVGAAVLVLNTGELRLTIGNGSAAANIATSTATLVPSAWNVIGIGFSEGGGAGASTLFVNGVSETFNGAITSPSASDAATGLVIGARNGTSQQFANGTRLHSLSMTATTLAASGFDALYARLESQ